MKKKLNIALIHDNLGNLIDGAIISTTRFGELLKKKGHNVIFISGRDVGDNEEQTVINGIKTYKFPAIIRVVQSKRRFFLTYPNKEKLKKILLKEKIDIVHIMIPVASAFRVIKAARELGIKIVIHSHTQPENMLLYLPKLFRHKIINNMCYKYIVWVYSKGDIVLCPSLFAESMLRKYSHKLKTEVISNGVDLKRFSKDTSKIFKEKYDLDKTEKRIVYVGRIDPEKRIDSLIRAMRIVSEKNKNVHLDIVGSGIQVQKMQKLSENFGLKDKVTFYGKVSEEDLIGAYNAADIFVLPSLVELEGMVVLEAMACGKPLIIANSKDSAAKDFVTDNGLLFKPENEIDLAKKINFLLTNPNQIKKMGEASLENIKEFSIHKSVAKLEQSYYHLLK